MLLNRIISMKNSHSSQYPNKVIQLSNKVLFSVLKLQKLFFLSELTLKPQVRDCNTP